ncbi:hypothetical protein AHAS_Ahas04G0186200 [Arachis hypogaea]
MTQFGIALGPNDHRGSGVKLAWFRILKRRQHLTDAIHKFRWGSACLAHMYRSLCRASRYDCKDIDGPMPLLLFVWDAYSPNRIAPHLIPFEINDGAELWSANVPLICFETVEWHPTDRVRRQFDFHQDSPVEPRKFWNMHGIKIQSMHKRWLSRWMLIH